MASIKDVAKLAGVGLGTASRAISGNGYVAPETRKKIEEAARALQYTPNVLAQNLLKNSSGIIGILIPSLSHCFYAELVQCLEAELYKKGYKTMVCCTVHEGDSEQDYLDMLENNLVDGIITATHSFNDKAYLKSGRVIVSFDRDFGGKIPMVCSDHEAAGKMAAGKFAASGCTQVLSIYGEDTAGGHISVGKAHETLRKKLEEKLIKVREAYIDGGKFDTAYYKEMADKCLSGYPDIDGVFASDPLAVQFLFQALKREIQVPKDLKIISYDGTEITRSVYPDISAVRQNIEKLAETLTEVLIKRLSGEKVSETTVTEVFWQEGGTCV